MQELLAEHRRLCPVFQAAIDVRRGRYYVLLAGGASQHHVDIFLMEHNTRKITQLLIEQTRMNSL